MRGSFLVYLPAAISLFAQQPAANLLQNPGFESPIFGSAWFLDPGLTDKGIGGQSAFGTHSGRYSLRLVPNQNNEGGLRGAGSYAFAQVFPISQLRGKSVFFSGWLMANGEATAVLRLSAITTSGALYYREIRQPAGFGRPFRRRDVLDIPDDPELAGAVLLCLVDGKSGSAFFDDLVVSLETPSDWLVALGLPDPGPELRANVEVRADQETRPIPRTIYGTNTEYVWNGQGIWDEQNRRIDPTLLRLTRELGASILRFPGGFFSDFYHWRNGVGPHEYRPSVLSLPNSSLTGNSFGTDEALAFAQAADAQLIITVNMMTGTPQDAAEWVRYVNNGSRRVEYWELGNELYVDHRVFNPDLPIYTPELYARRFLEFAEAMRSVDPTIKLLASTEFNYGLTTYHPYPNWVDTLLKVAGSQINYLAVHNAFAPGLGHDAGWNARTVYSSMLAAPSSIRDNLGSLSRKITELAGSRANEIKIAVSEWGPIFTLDPGYRFVDHSKTLASAIYSASILKILLEDQRVDIANSFKLVDPFYMGWIGPREGQYIPKAPYLAMQMFSKHFGSRLVPNRTVSPTYESRSLGWVDSDPFVPYLEIVTSKSDDERTLYIMGINKHFDRSISATVLLHGFCPDTSATAWSLIGEELDSNTGTELISTSEVSWAEQTAVIPNGRFHDGSPEAVKITREEVNIGGERFEFSFPKHSVTSIQITGQNQTCAVGQEVPTP
jgi:alpha-L-arabinofuranosidase